MNTNKNSFAIGIKKRIITLISLHLLLLNLSCSQSVEPNKDVNLIALSQTGAHFSSDGERIVFEGLYDSIYAVHFIDLSGNYLGNILHKKGYLSAPSWSPDNKKIAVSIEGNIFIVQIDGDSLTRLTNTGEDFFCNWSPDGRYIAYTKSICDPECGIAIYDLNNKNKKIIGQYGGYASWNKNSERVYYYHTLYSKRLDSDKSDYQGFVFKRKNIVTDVEDSLYYVNDSNKFLQYCSVSPDEQEILFAAGYGSPPVINIWKINVQNGQITQMTYDGGNFPSYNPAGDKIVYTNSNINEGGLWIMNRDGSNKQRLTKLKR